MKLFPLGMCSKQRATTHRSHRRVYVHRDSYVRTASGAYDAANTGDKSIHLVNDAVQIKYDTYGAFEDSNKLNLAEV